MVYPFQTSFGFHIETSYLFCICFAEQNKLLVFVWNTTLDSNGLMGHFSLSFNETTVPKCTTDEIFLKNFKIPGKKYLIGTPFCSKILKKFLNCLLIFFLALLRSFYKVIATSLIVKDKFVIAHLLVLYDRKLLILEAFLCCYSTRISCKWQC